MLIIQTPDIEQWNEKTQEFISIKGQTLKLEHSLVSISKWESKWCKPFISDQTKTKDETIDYIRCMLLNEEEIDTNCLYVLTSENHKEIGAYIESPMTATWFPKEKGHGNRTGEQLTSELIYYYMVALQIPFECQYWHLNRLMTLIRVCSVKNQPGKKMSRRDILSRNASLNAARKRSMNTNG